MPPREYAGHCPCCDREHRFVNDAELALSLLDRLFTQLALEPESGPVRAALDASPGKMLGVLVAEAEDGTRHVLQAFSGELDGQADWPGWVRSVLRREDTADLEAETLARIAGLEEQIASCDVAGAHRRFVETRASVVSEASRRRKAARAQRHEWTRARRAGSSDVVLLDRLAQEALQAEAAATAEDEARIAAARHAFDAEEARLRTLRAQRRDASVALSAAMFAAAALTNARGERRPLQDIFVGEGIPGGTAGCAVPKLLEAANVARLRPVALAEAWWGPTLNGRHHGDVQPPCDRKCKPILGHLLCGGDAA
jgi:tRNA pseudouridine32 synthase/23S rRNA pseudouridine746 synthase